MIRTEKQVGQRKFREEEDKEKKSRQRMTHRSN